MPTIDENLAWWGTTYHWSQGGDEWSREWGTPEAQWYGSILPRIHAFVPAVTILEIAPGFGRWTHYLRALCSSLVLVDLNARCIDACRRRFADEHHIAYHVTDGRSLEMVADRTVDFAFSFDSLVHAELDVLDAYLEQLARKLTSDGVGFLHHSHLAAYEDAGLEIPFNKQWRAPTVSAERVRECCRSHGLACPSQEIVNWENDYLSDVFSVITPLGSPWDAEERVHENPRFMLEAEMVAATASLYSRWPTG